MKGLAATVSLGQTQKIVREEIEKTRQEIRVARDTYCSLASLLHPAVNTLGSLETRILNRIRNEA